MSFIVKCKSVSPCFTVTNPCLNKGMHVLLVYANLFYVDCETSSTTYINHSRRLISDSFHRHEGMRAVVILLKLIHAELKSRAVNTCFCNFTYKHSVAVIKSDVIISNVQSSKRKRVASK